MSRGYGRAHIQLSIQLTYISLLGRHYCATIPNGVHAKSSYTMSCSFNLLPKLCVLFMGIMDGEPPSSCLCMILRTSSAHAGFTPMCKQLEPRVVMTFLNDLFTRFDHQLDEFGVYKVGISQWDWRCGDYLHKRSCAQLM